MLDVKKPLKWFVSIFQKPKIVKVHYIHREKGKVKMKVVLKEGGERFTENFIKAISTNIWFDQKTNIPVNTRLSRLLDIEEAWDMVYRELPLCEKKSQQHAYGRS